MAFAASVAETATSRAVTRPAVQELILVAPVAVAIWLATRRHGAYEISTLVVGVLIQIVWMRNARVTATALLTLAAAGVLIVPLRHVDAALFAGHVAHTIRVYVILAFASAAIAGTLAQISVPLPGTNPQAAWSQAATATRLDPWDEEARATQASIAESIGEFALAARKYQDAAAFAQQPWADYYREALAWQQAGSTSLRLRACRAARAQNPLEPLLARDRCG